MAPRRLLATALLLLAVTAPASQAAVTVYMNLVWQTAYTNVAGDVYLDTNKIQGTYWGPFKGYRDEAATIRWTDFYCIDLQQGSDLGWRSWVVRPTNDPSLYTMAGFQGTPFGLGWASALYNGLAPALVDVTGTAAEVGRAALQLAIWEALYDGALGYGADFRTGRFTVDATHCVDVQTIAAGFLADARYKFQDAAGHWHDGQDLLGPRTPEIPEPGTLLLLGLGLGLLGSTWILRHRRRF